MLRLDAVGFGVAVNKLDYLAGETALGDTF